MRKVATKVTAGVVTAFTSSLLFASKAFAQSQGSVIQIGSVDTLLWSIVKTIQFYTLPIMAIALAFLGIKLVMSGDDSGAKENVKGWMIKILIGSLIVFGATTIATVLKGAVGG